MVLHGEIHEVVGEKFTVLCMPNAGSAGSSVEPWIKEEGGAKRKEISDKGAVRGLCLVQKSAYCTMQLAAAKTGDVTGSSILNATMEANGRARS